MSETPHPAGQGAPPKVTFQILWNEADNQRTRYRIWREANGADPAAAFTLADLDERIAVYDAMARLIERVRDDGHILDRLRAIAAEEAARAAAESIASDEAAADS